MDPAFSHDLEIAMHTQLKTMFATLLLGSALVVSAADEHHPATPPAVPAEASPADQSVQRQAMAEQMQKMQAAHDKVAAAKTPAERQAAMMESMATMQEGMVMMRKHHEASGCMGMGMGMSGAKGGMGMGMMDMMMKMMDQQTDMLKMPMGQ